MIDPHTTNDLWKLLPGTEPVTFRSWIRQQRSALVQSVPAYNDYPIPNAKRQRRPDGYDLGLIAGKNPTGVSRLIVVWKIWSSQLPVVPKMGDLIVDSTGVGWSVETVEIQMLNNRYRCTCVMDNLDYQQSPPQLNEE